MMHPAAEGKGERRQRRQREGARNRRTALSHTHSHNDRFCDSRPTESSGRQQKIERRSEEAVKCVNVEGEIVVVNDQSLCVYVV